MKHRKASSGVHTMGSPRTLKLVFTSTGHRFLRHRLDRRGDVHVELGQRLICRPRRLSEQCIEAAVGHAQTGAVVEGRRVERAGGVTEVMVGESQPRRDVECRVQGQGLKLAGQKILLEQFLLESHRERLPGRSGAPGR